MLKVATIERAEVGSKDCRQVSVCKMQQRVNYSLRRSSDVLECLSTGIQASIVPDRVGVGSEDRSCRYYAVVIRQSWRHPLINQGHRENDIFDQS
jgi:hypothetical protein